MYLFFVLVLVLRSKGKYRQRRECAFEKNLRFVSNATFTTKNDKNLKKKIQERCESFAFVCGST